MLLRMEMPELPELKPWHYAIVLLVLLLLVFAFLPPAQKPVEPAASPSPTSFVRNVQNYSGKTFSFSQQVVRSGSNTVSTFSFKNYRDIRLGLADVLPAKFAKSVNNVSLETVPPILTKLLDFYPIIQYSSFNATSISRKISSNDADKDGMPLHLLVPPDLTDEQQEKLGGILRKLALMDLTPEESAAIQKKWNEAFDSSIEQNVSADDFIDAAEKLVDAIEKAKLFAPPLPSPSIAAGVSPTLPAVTTAATPSSTASPSATTQSPSAIPSAAIPAASPIPSPLPSPRPLSQKEIEDLPVNFPKNASSIFPELPEEIVLTVSEVAPFDSKEFEFNYSKVLGAPLLRVVGSAYKYASARVSGGKLVVDALVDAELDANGLFPFDSVTGTVLMAFATAAQEEFKIPLRIVVEHVVLDDVDPADAGVLPTTWQAQASNPSVVSQYKQRFLNAPVPEKLAGRVPMQGRPDLKTIEQYHPEVLRAYEELCREMGVQPYPSQRPGVISSGYRNYAPANGVSNSPHMYAMALDISVGGICEQMRWARVAKDIFTRVGVYPDSSIIHVDMMPRGFGSPHWVRQNGRYIGKQTFDQVESAVRAYNCPVEQTTQPTPPSQQVTPATGHSVVGGPSISVATIRAILQTIGSPALGSEQCFYDLSAKYQIDVAPMLGFFLKESGMGTAAGYSSTHAIGNIVTAGAGSQFCDPTKRVGSRFCGYSDWCKAAEHWYYYIKNSPLYLPNGKDTPEEILPIYAPSSDNNDPTGYAQTVNRCVAIWRQYESGQVSSARCW